MSTLKEKEALDKLTHLSQSCKQHRGIIRSYSESYQKHPDWSWRGTWEQNSLDKKQQATQIFSHKGTYSTSIVSLKAF